MLQREHWTRSDWIGTLALCVLFPPIGIAAILRWVSKQPVWYHERNSQ